MKLTNCQQKALTSFHEFMSGTEKYMTLSGKAGTGKTTLLKNIFEHMMEMSNLKDMLLDGYTDDIPAFQLTATTNKAASVASKASGFVCKTIHNALDLVLIRDYNTGEQMLQTKGGRAPTILTTPLLIVEEASFLNQEMLDWIERATPNTQVLLVGHDRQLALGDDTEIVAFTQGWKSVELEEIVRQPPNTRLVDFCNELCESVVTHEFHPITPDGDTVMEVGREQFDQMINEEFGKEHLGTFDARIVTWTNARSQYYNDNVVKLRGGNLLYSVQRVNEFTQAGFHTDQELTVTHIGKNQRTIEGINCLNYSFGGDESAWVPINSQDYADALKECKRQKNWKQYFKLKDNIVDLRPGYSCTAHKSQGSTFETVFIDLAELLNCKDVSVLSRLLYVAVSRASHRVVLCVD